ncbi:MAG: DUF362 domain-containing protein [Desulfovibrionales bacterium]
MNRREFLIWQAKTALWLGAGTSGLLLPRKGLADTGPDLAVTTGAPGAATRAAVELVGGMSTYVKKGSRVVIKPNMSFAQPPERGTTTHPEVVATLTSMCLEAGASRVRVLDHTLNNKERCLEQTGIRDLCEPLGRDIVQGMSDSDQFRESEIPQGEAMRSTEVMKEVLDADVLIAAPTAKHHGSTGVSLAMKGMMGLIYNRSIMHWRYDLHTAIVDLCTLLRPALTVIDAAWVLTSNGPGGPGDVERMDTVIASADMVAADAQAVTLVKWYGQAVEPRMVKHIRLAHERGLGRMDIENLRVQRVDV